MFIPKRKSKVSLGSTSRTQHRRNLSDFELMLRKIKTDVLADEKKKVIGPKAISYRPQAGASATENTR